MRPGWPQVAPVHLSPEVTIICTVKSCLKSYDQPRQHI